MRWQERAAIAGGGLLAAVAVVSRSEGAQRAATAIELRIAPAVPLAPAWRRRVLALVTASEGSFGSVNRNTDGAGASVGILSWAQATGGLGQLLRAMYARDPARFAQTFGPSWQQLLTTTEASSLAPVGGAVLWAEPWVSRFRAAGLDPVWQAVQLDLATEGPWWRGAEAAAAALGVPPTERVFAVLLDTSVQQGPGFALKHARRAAAAAPPVARLTWFVEHAADAYRRTTAPTEPHPRSPRLTWQPASDGSWHVYAGRVDLHADILRRRRRLLRSTVVTDTPISLAPQQQLSGPAPVYAAGAAGLLRRTSGRDLVAFVQDLAHASTDAADSRIGSTDTERAGVGLGVAFDDT